MNQKKKVLLVLYYQWPCNTDQINDMLWHCNSTVLSDLKRMWLITLYPRKKQNEQWVRDLNEAWCNVAEMIKKDISFWTYVKLCLGVRVW